MPDPLEVRVLRLESWKEEMVKALRVLEEELSLLREDMAFLKKGRK